MLGLWLGAASGRLTKGNTHIFLCIKCYSSQLPFYIFWVLHSLCEINIMMPCLFVYLQFQTQLFTEDLIYVRNVAGLFLDLIFFLMFSFFFNFCKFVHCIKAITLQYCGFGPYLKLKNSLWSRDYSSHLKKREWHPKQWIIYSILTIRSVLGLGFEPRSPVITAVLGTRLLQKGPR